MYVVSTPKGEPMLRLALKASAFLLAVCLLQSPSSNARELTFDERVDAQEAIERVYYSYQIGATKSFEEAPGRPTSTQIR